MPQQVGCKIAIKDSARRENRAVDQLYKEEGGILEYESRAAAKEDAEKFSSSGNGRVAVQRAAPNDPSDVDGYLVYAPVQNKHTPKGTLEDSWTFDTTANQYGALGETLITTRGIPALKHFVQQDLAPFPSEEIQKSVRVKVKTEPSGFDWESLRSAIGDNRVNWTPDCEVIVTLGYPSVEIHRYVCEIKTGDASFERNQQDAMRAASEDIDVLKIRVRIDELPTQYSVKFQRVGDSKAEINWQSKLAKAEGLSADQTDLSEFH